MLPAHHAHPDEAKLEWVGSEVFSAGSVFLQAGAAVRRAGSVFLRAGFRIGQGFGARLTGWSWRSV